MKIIHAIFAFCAMFAFLEAQSVNPLSITPTSPSQFRLDWMAVNQHRYQIEGSPDLVNWTKVGPIVTGTGASQTMLVGYTPPKYFYNLCEGGLRPGFDGLSLSREDDHTYPQYTVPGIRGDAAEVSLGFTVNFFGELYSSCYVNNNGNISFGNGFRTFTPLVLRDLGQKLIAPFWADVDTRNILSSVTKFTSGGETVHDHPAFGVTYKNVGYFDTQADKLNSFQLILIERFDTGQNNFDIEFNYEKILWETGDASFGSNGYGGLSARAGVTNGESLSVEINGSGTHSAFLDSNPSTGLIYQSYNTNAPGRFIFHVRGGVIEDTFTVNAGPDQLVAENHSAAFQLSGSVNPPGIAGVSYMWIQKNGPAPATFSNSSILNPIVTIPEPGDYEFELTGTSTGLAIYSARDTVSISHPGIFDVYAGDAVDLTPPASLTQTLHGLATFSGGVAVSVVWTQTSGVATSINNPNLLEPAVTLPGPGFYVFKMTATTVQSSPFTQSSVTTINYNEE